MNKPHSINNQVFNVFTGIKKSLGNLPAPIFKAIHKPLSKAAWLLPALFWSVSAVHAGSSVTLEWDRSASESILGYKLKYGTASGTYTASVEVGDTTTYTLSNLTEGGTYYFAVTAFNAAGVESLPSNEVVFQAALPEPEPEREPDPPVIFTELNDYLSGMGLNAQMVAYFNQQYLSPISNTSLSYSEAVISPPAVPLSIETVSPSEHFYEEFFVGEESVFAWDPLVQISNMYFIQDMRWSFAILAPVDYVFKIYGSTNNQTWRLLDTVENSMGMITVTETAPNNLPRQSYRVLPVAPQEEEPLD